MVLISPLKVPKTKVKYFILNLNVYRNTHYQTLNKVKQNYKTHMTGQILALPKLSKISIEYKLFPRTKRLCDISNILSIHDKMFCDALVELGKLEDDNYLFIPQITYCIGEIDKINPRVEITLTNL